MTELRTSEKVVTEEDATERRAANALVRWRRSWEREHCSPPTANYGFERELPLWRVAGQLMKLRGIKRRLP